jgi:hypothetical protein
MKNESSAHRDLTVFPDDDNGDVLWRMQQNGDNLSTPREIDFSIIFPTEDEVLAFAIYLLRNDQKVSFSPYDGDEEMPWQVQAHPFMAPTYDAISEYEAQLAEDSAEFNGRNDGWGCMQQV